MKKFVTHLPKANITSDWRYFGLVLMVAPVLVWLSSSLWIWWDHRIYYLEEYPYPVQWDLVTVLAYNFLVGGIFYIPAMAIGLLLYKTQKSIYTFGPPYGINTSLCR